MRPFHEVLRCFTDRSMKERRTERQTESLRWFTAGQKTDQHCFMATAWTTKYHTSGQFRRDLGFNGDWSWSLYYAMKRYLNCFVVIFLILYFFFGYSLCHANETRLRRWSRNVNQKRHMKTPVYFHYVSMVTALHRGLFIDLLRDWHS